MKSEDVIKQLQATLPTVTDRFSEQLQLASVVPTGTTALATLVTPLTIPFVNGQVVTISGTLAPVVIDSINRSGTVASVVTQTPHDITEGFHDTVVISGANESEFNGSFKLLSAKNRMSFQFEMADAGATVATGSLLLDSPPSAFGFNGLVAVSNPTTTTFEYTLPQPLTESAVGTGIVHTASRVSGGTEIERIQAMYTKDPPEDLWAWVVLGSTETSQDRNTRADFITGSGPGGERKLLIFQSVSVYVFVPTSDSLSGREAMDLMQDVLVDLLKSLAFWKPPTTLASTLGLGLIFSGHRPQSYLEAYYVHEFSFEHVEQITRADTVASDFNVAFRDISLSINPSTGDEVMTANVDLDDVPIGS